MNITMNITTRLVFLLTACLFSVTVPAKDVPDHPAERVAEHTWVIHGPLGDPSVENVGFMNNPAFVVTRDGVVVIDPGSSVQVGRMVLRQIRKVTDKPVIHVLNTHVHGDHWLGNHALQEVFPDARFMAHPLMIQSAIGGQAARWLELMERLTHGATRGTRAVIPTIPVVEDQRLEIGGMSFRILAPPKAHSGTDIMIHVVEEGVLFLGDNVMNGRFGGMGDGTFRGSITACDRALAVDAKVFVPGHGRSGDKQVVGIYRDYLLTLFDTARAQYDLGKQDYEMKDVIRAKLGRFVDWVGFDLNFGRHISTAVLEIEAM